MPESSGLGLTEPARAKVNLYLRIVGEREDGYHLLDSLVVFAGAADLVRAEAASGLSLIVDGPFRAGLADENDNLVLRAARKLAAMARVVPRAALTLTKNLPVASGIGGGSADAAATLRVLCRLWRVSLTEAALMRLAAELGADVPVCLHSMPARMAGVGEELGPAPLLPKGGLVLVNPGVAVSTAAVFRARSAGFSASAELPAGWATVAAMAEALALVGNDLETAAIALSPEIGVVLAWLRARPGCLLARMSGSGATCFALFANGEAAAFVAASAPAGWWAWGSEILR